MLLKIDLQAFLKDFHLFAALWWFTLEHVAVVGFWWGSIFRQGRIIPILCKNRVNDHWNMSHDKKLKYVIIKTLQKVYLKVILKLNPILFYQRYKVKKLNHLFPNLCKQPFSSQSLSLYHTQVTLRTVHSGTFSVFNCWSETVVLYCHHLVKRNGQEPYTKQNQYKFLLNCKIRLYLRRFLVKKQNKNNLDRTKRTNSCSSSRCILLLIYYILNIFLKKTCLGRTVFTYLSSFNYRIPSMCTHTVIRAIWNKWFICKEKDIFNISPWMWEITTPHYYMFTYAVVS